MAQPTTRRTFVQLLAASPLLLAGGHARAGDALIGRLIKQAQAHPQIAQRMEFISRALMGIRYRADTLIGGPRNPEVFVVRDDAFDCVTYCEVVLAAAIAKDRAEFETVLKQIRYDHGNVSYDRRNHYFADWNQRNIENGICRAVAMEPSVTIDKVATSQREFGPRRLSFTGIPRATLLANTRLLARGDIIGFVSRRSYLDFFHCGLVSFGKDGMPIMRHASLSHGRVAEERLDNFIAVNGVKWVSLLRAVDGAPIAQKT